MESYDLIIIGGGPAGLTAGIYAARAKLKTAVFEKMMPGGQMATTEQLDNYPGFPDGISGWELADHMRRQCEKWGAKFITAEVLKIRNDGQLKVIETSGNGEYSAKAVILALGAKPRWLNVPGEKEFAGRGVSWCATCDGAFYEGAEVCVIGGGNSAVEEGLYLTKFAKKVTFIQNLSEFTATPYYVDKLKENPKTEAIMNATVEEIVGTDKVEKVIIRDVNTGEKREIQTNGVFVYIGMQPATGWVGGFVEVDPAGYIITDQDMRTNVPGVFAAGDVRQKQVRQVSNAVGDGTVAAIMAEKYISETE